MSQRTPLEEIELVSARLDLFRQSQLRYPASSKESLDTQIARTAKEMGQRLLELAERLCEESPEIRDSVDAPPKSVWEHPKVRDAAARGHAMMKRHPSPFAG